VNLYIKFIRFTYTYDFTYSQHPLSKYVFHSQILIGAAMTTYTQNCSRSIVGHPAGALDILKMIFRQWMKNQRLRLKLAHERRQLQGMSDTILRDIGVSRAAADAEALRSDIPENRRGLC
jgi:uncharacterized protein YjiS (DUF1127 family)